MPKFSIIVGMYNQKEYLPALIDSLNRQTFRDFEVHFCDDGSDDGTEEFFELRDVYDGALEIEIPTNFPFKYHRQRHRGMRLAKNINQGIRAARGEYCVFIMADSMPELDYLEILNSYVAHDRVICGIRIQIAEVGGRTEGVDIDWRIKKKVIPEIPTVVIGFPWKCLTGNGLTIPTAALRLYGPWCEELEGYGGEDNEIVARLFYKGYLCWSVPDLRIYHHWHISRESSIENNRIVADKVKEYER